MGAWNFRGFIRFFQKGLNPFKIQARFKFELFLDFLIPNTEGHGSGTKMESCSLLSHWPAQKVSPFLDIGKIMFVNFEVGALEKHNKSGPRAHMSATTSSSDRTPRDSVLSRCCPHHAADSRPRQLLLRRTPPAPASTRSSCSRYRCALSAATAHRQWNPSSPLRSLFHRCSLPRASLRLPWQPLMCRTTTPECPSCRSGRCLHRCPCGLHPRVTPRWIVVQKCHAESLSCHACILHRRESASTPMARLRPGPPLLWPPWAPHRSRAPLRPL
jgi:hypothetical protein